MRLPRPRHWSMKQGMPMSDEFQVKRWSEFRRRLVAGLDRDVEERRPVEIGPALGVGMVADDERDIASEFAALMPIEQIDQLFLATDEIDH